MCTNADEFSLAETEIKIQVPIEVSFEVTVDITVEYSIVFARYVRVLRHGAGIRQ
jgi:hypothetical protein